MVLHNFKQWRKNRQLKKWKEIDERNSKSNLNYEKVSHRGAKPVDEKLTSFAIQTNSLTSY